MITKFNTTTVAPESGSKGSGFGTIIVLGLLAVAAYFGYKHFTKEKEPEQ